MLGILLRRELLSTARSMQVFRWRLGYGIILFLELIVAPQLLGVGVYTVSGGPTWLVEMIGGFVIVQQYLLVFALAPVFGTISVNGDQSTGALIEFMITPTTSSEIILAKWLGVMVRIIDLAILPLPVVMLFGSLISTPMDGARWVLTPLVWLPLVAAISVLAGVIIRSFSEAVLFAVFVPIAFVGWRTWVNLTEVGDLIAPLRALLISGLGTMLALSWAILRLRTKVMQHALPEASRRWRGFQNRLPIGDQPIRWLEKHRLPTPILRWFPPIVPVIAFGLVCGGLAWWNAIEELATVPNPFERGALLGYAGIVLGLGTSIFGGVRGAMSITSERSQNTWDPIRMSPVTAAEFIQGKVWGVFDGVWPYIIAYLIGTLSVTIAYQTYMILSILIGAGLFAVLAYWSVTIGVHQSIRPTADSVAIAGTLGVIFGKLILVSLFIIVPVGCCSCCCLSSMVSQIQWSVFMQIMFTPIVIFFLIRDAGKQRSAATRSLGAQLRPEAAGVDPRYSESGEESLRWNAM